MGKNKINVALLGLGRIGQMHAENLIKHRKFKDLAMVKAGLPILIKIIIPVWKLWELIWKGSIKQ